MDLRERYGLLIDDMAEMRSSMRIQLADAGLEKCDVARNVKEAVDRLGSRNYDLIVCDYNLGQGADGQQLLELVRRRHLLPLTTAFLMVTGETGYEQVSTAAEYAPDDYLLKPFTAGTLGTRLARILEKKGALSPVYQHLGERGDKARALAVCDELLPQLPRYALDLLRIKGELLLHSSRVDEALALYADVLATRSTPWAQVGKARALALAGDEAGARTTLASALEAYPNYLAAYDSLAALLKKTDGVAAQQVVEQALKVAPTTQRQRQLGALALDNQDFGRAEEAFRRAVEKDRSGFFKSHDDYAGLAKSYSAQGKTQEALTAVKDMATHFARTPELAARQAAVESLVHVKSGNPVAAREALERALAVGQESGLDAATQLELAQACFANGRQEVARRIIEAVAEDNSENDAVIAQAQTVFANAGLKDEGTVFLEATRKRMIKLNNEAVGLVKAGELEQAISLLQEAADRLTNNCQIAVNAAVALLLFVRKHGANRERLEQARRYIMRAMMVNPSHAKLGEAKALYRQVAPADAPGLDG